MAQYRFFLQWLLVALPLVASTLGTRTERARRCGNCPAVRLNDEFNENNSVGTINYRNSFPHGELITSFVRNRFKQRGMNIPMILSVHNEGQALQSCANSSLSADKVFYVSLRLYEDHKFTKELENSSSVQYHHLTREVEDMFDSAYNNSSLSSSYVGAKVLKFRKGSVIADVKLEFSSRRHAVPSDEKEQERAVRRIRSITAKNCSDAVCHANATCINATGGWHCKCFAGYAGDGVNCSRSSVANHSSRAEGLAVSSVTVSGTPDLKSSYALGTKTTHLPQSIHLSPAPESNSFPPSPLSSPSTSFPSISAGDSFTKITSETGSFNSSASDGYIPKTLHASTTDFEPATSLPSTIISAASEVNGSENRHTPIVNSSVPFSSGSNASLQRVQSIERAQALSSTMNKLDISSLLTDATVSSVPVLSPTSQALIHANLSSRSKIIHTSNSSVDYFAMTNTPQAATTTTYPASTSQSLRSESVNTEMIFSKHSSFYATFSKGSSYENQAESLNRSQDFAVNINQTSQTAVVASEPNQTPKSRTVVTKSTVGLSSSYVDLNSRTFVTMVQPANQPLDVKSTSFASYSAYSPPTDTSTPKIIQSSLQVTSTSIMRSKMSTKGTSIEQSTERETINFDPSIQEISYTHITSSSSDKSANPTQPHPSFTLAISTNPSSMSFATHINKSYKNLESLSVTPYSAPGTVNTPSSKTNYSTSVSTLKSSILPRSHISFSSTTQQRFSTMNEFLSPGSFSSASRFHSTNVTKTTLSSSSVPQLSLQLSSGLQFGNTRFSPTPTYFSFSLVSSSLSFANYTAILVSPNSSFYFLSQPSVLKSTPASSFLGFFNSSHKPSASLTSTTISPSLGSSNRPNATSISFASTSTVSTFHYLNPINNASNPLPLSSYFLHFTKQTSTVLPSTSTATIPSDFLNSTRHTRDPLVPTSMLLSISSLANATKHNSTPNARLTPTYTSSINGSSFIHPTPTFLTSSLSVSHATPKLTINLTTMITTNNASTPDARLTPKSFINGMSFIHHTSTSSISSLTVPYVTTNLTTNVTSVTATNQTSTPDARLKSTSSINGTSSIHSTPTSSTSSLSVQHITPNFTTNLTSATATNHTSTPDARLTPTYTSSINGTSFIYPTPSFSISSLTAPHVTTNLTTNLTSITNTNYTSTADARITPTYTSTAKSNTRSFIHPASTSSISSLTVPHVTTNLTTNLTSITKYSSTPDARLTPTSSINGTSFIQPTLTSSISSLIVPHVTTYLTTNLTSITTINYTSTSDTRLTPTYTSSINGTSFIHSTPTFSISSLTVPHITPNLTTNLTSITTTNYTSTSDTRLTPTYTSSINGTSFIHSTPTFSISSLTVPHITSNLTTNLISITTINYTSSSDTRLTPTYTSSINGTSFIHSTSTFSISSLSVPHTTPNLTTNLTSITNTNYTSTSDTRLTPTYTSSINGTSFIHSTPTFSISSLSVLHITPNLTTSLTSITTTNYTSTSDTRLTPTYTSSINGTSFIHSTPTFSISSLTVPHITPNLTTNLISITTTNYTSTSYTRLTPTYTSSINSTFFTHSTSNSSTPPSVSNVTTNLSTNITSTTTTTTRNRTTSTTITSLITPTSTVLSLGIATNSTRPSLSFLTSISTVSSFSSTPSSYISPPLVSTSPMPVLVSSVNTTLTKRFSVIPTYPSSSFGISINSSNDTKSILASTPGSSSFLRSNSTNYVSKRFTPTFTMSLLSSSLNSSYRTNIFSTSKSSAVSSILSSLKSSGVSSSLLSLSPTFSHLTSSLRSSNLTSVFRAPISSTASFVASFIASNHSNTFVTITTTSAISAPKFSSSASNDTSISLTATSTVPYEPSLYIKNETVFALTPSSAVSMTDVSSHLTNTTRLSTPSLTTVQSTYQKSAVIDTTVTASSVSSSAVIPHSTNHTLSVFGQHRNSTVDITSFPWTSRRFLSAVSASTYKAYTKSIKPANYSAASTIQLFTRSTPLHSSSLQSRSKIFSIYATHSFSVNSTSVTSTMKQLLSTRFSLVYQMLSSSSTPLPQISKSMLTMPNASTVDLRQTSFPLVSSNLTVSLAQTITFSRFASARRSKISSQISPSLTVYTTVQVSKNTATTPAPSSGVRMMTTNVTIANRNYTLELLNSSSREYNELESEVKSSLTPFIEQIQGFKRIDVNKFWRGSVVADMNVIFNSSSNTTRKELEDVILAGNATNRQGLIFSVVVVKERCTAGYCMDHGQCSKIINSPDLKCSCFSGYTGKRCSFRAAGSDDDDDFEEYWIAIGVCGGLLILIITLMIILAMRRRRKYYVTRESVMSVGRTSGDVFFNPAYGDSREYLADSNNPSTVVPLEVVYENSSFKNNGDYKNSEFVNNKKDKEENEEEDIYKTQLLLFLKQNNLLKNSNQDDAQTPTTASRRSSTSSDSDEEDRL